ncbi:mycothione reductase [Corynebacterium caspium]|uniref:mycothione reductase n=1 Tax=Corynebacterium caspium TaxID=234828 RepID=UPI000367D6A1|nr:mycothione reductase [Corynebacterium caspium]WKD59079.1 Mycothione reductase [Corynebacterium caspium DSM 44850]
MSTPAVDKHYDLVIIGTGSGNSLPDERFDDMSIAIVEEGIFGGTCLNAGCIPTKMMVHAADLAYDAANSEKFGLDTTYNGVRWQDLTNRIFAQRIDLIAKGGEAYRRGPETPNIEVYDGHATFIAPRTISTAQGGIPKIISGDQIVVAAGSRAVIPEVIAESGVRYRTNWDIMRLPEQPESLIIYGGGYIAMEFAHVFASLGTKITIIARSGQVLRHLDAEIGAAFNEIASKRWDIRYNSTISQLRQEDNSVVATLSDGSEIRASEILVATGRVSNADQLNLEAAGIAMEHGRLAVDKYGRSISAPGIWALGDISSPYLLKHVANAEARAVQHNLLYPEDLQELPHEHIPAAVFTHPQIATVGLTEKQASDAGHNYTVKVQRFADVAYGWAMEDQSGIIKLIADKDSGLLLGAHIMGPQASTLLQQLITFMVYEIDMRTAARKQYWIHPALNEVVENALLGLDFS